ncbi:TlpA family protein disulfide reductase [Pedobacter insulae]|uniref:Thiol-disulfide isomerase or thioredoxin n=1 Tax=Pedobacter insulae TaxID=414048 RepID=A0A1I2Y582_9SPHI|nr:TlpA disulfide reductase family protein [Pedobacter insulae]SFH19511.1 Thiol-disulfide isomerase or thioredoxin [Pedobacter insulae]
MMKKITALSVLALLCLNFCVNAQENKAVDVIKRGLQIGQMVPEVKLTNLYNYKSTTANLSDFKGRLVILDFWATWCQPCVAMIPQMDSLQKVFGNKIQFISTTYQTANEVIPFLKKFEKQQGRHFSIPVLTDQKELNALFPHVYLPHYVWIDGEGKVIAITDHKEINAKSIQEALLRQTSSFQKKADMQVAYDPRLPLVASSDLGAVNKIYYQSLLTGFIDGLHSGYNTRYTIKSDLPRKVTFTNISIETLFSVAMGEQIRYFRRNQMIVELKDTLAFGRVPKSLTYKEWRKTNAFCYELIVPNNLRLDVFKIMTEDLRRVFSQYIVGFEKRKVKCLVLTKTADFGKIDISKLVPVSPDDNKLKKFANVTFTKFIYHCNSFYMQHSKLPVIDGTGYLGKVNIELTGFENVNKINLELAKYGLAFVEKEAEIDMLVFRDNPLYVANKTPSKDEK